ncbi:flagellar basal-body rod modification protein FlgD [Caldalkalibacillus uzonensis]|uniref:Flagellar basal-body rod modification protein FlgD n=1 Tax=Caldalkalibacillus uzonensis TaxID=353224 RepID=A0ABU0CLI0_9BACI|nr:flagellar hook assembly protein FlgD [Caldalkalibacillus uzonensis]MDQ0337269.1 flagellar basal-body rod modification protein FlgD [Caldalkalibacillus uzonensis]
MEKTASVQSTTHPYFRQVPTFEERSELGRDAFLRILIAQLRYQDPLNPMEDRDFIAQTAQFSSLEQLMAINQTMQDLTFSQLQQTLTHYSHLIGKKVYWETDSNNNKQSGEGYVNAVFVRDGEVMAELDSGKTIALKHVYRVEQAE